MHHLVRMHYLLLWTSSFMCHQTVSNSVPTRQEATGVHASVGINCPPMENHAQVSQHGKVYDKSDAKSFFISQNTNVTN